MVESQTAERMRLAGNLGGHLVQHPCLSRVTQRGFLRSVSRRLLSISKKGDPCNLSGQPLPVLGHPHSGRKKNKPKSVSLWFDGPSCVSLCLLLLALSLGITERILAPSLYTLPSDTDKIPFSLLFSRRSAPALPAFPCMRDAPIP